MKSALAGVWALAVLFGVPFSAGAQDKAEDQGISSPLLSRCAGKFGAMLRAGDEAFPLLGLSGVPWMNVEHTSQKVNGAHIVDIVTGIGGRNRRRGEVVGLRYRCLIDDKGEAVDFTWNDLLPERNEALPPAMLLRGTAYYQPKTQLAPGAELRVQLFDKAQDPPVLLTEAVIRSSWVEPIPFGLRLPPDMKLEGRKLVIDARLSMGLVTLYRLRMPLPLAVDQLQRPIHLVIMQVAGNAVY